MGGDADGPDQALFFLFVEIGKRLAMSIQGQGGLLLVEQEKIDYIEIQRQTRLVKTASGSFPVVGIAFAGDDWRCCDAAQGSTNVGICLIEFGCVDKINTPGKGMGEELTATFRGQVGLGWPQGQRPIAEPGNLNPSLA